MVSYIELEINNKPSSPHEYVSGLNRKILKYEERVTKAKLWFKNDKNHESLILEISMRVYTKHNDIGLRL